MQSRPHPSINKSEHVASLLRRGGIGKVSRDSCRVGVTAACENDASGSSEDEVVVFKGDVQGALEELPDDGAGIATIFDVTYSREKLLAMRFVTDQDELRIKTAEAAKLFNATCWFRQTGCRQGKGRGKAGRGASTFFVDAYFSDSPDFAAIGFPRQDTSSDASEAWITREGEPLFYFNEEVAQECSSGEEGWHCAKPEGGTQTGMFGPQYLALNLEPWKGSFQAVVNEFALMADREFHAMVPRIEPTCGAHASGSFQVPRCLHMTTWFLGRKVLDEAYHALELEGSLWQVKATHLIFVTETVLLAMMEVQDHALPMESACVPHVTLSTMPPFMPGDVRGLLRALWTQDVLHAAPVSADADRLRLVTNFCLGDTPRELYIFDLAGTGEVMQARLESFW